MAGVAIIGSRDVVTGFRALGVEAFTPAGPGEAAELLRDLASQGRHAVIFVEEAYAEGAEEVISELSGRALPCVTVIPGTGGSTGMHEKKLRELFRTAVGMDIT